MTQENYDYRTSPLFLRNQFAGKGKFQIPIVPKFQLKQDDFVDLRLIGFDKTNLESNNHLDRIVHFFLYDYKFERVWKNPDIDTEKLKRYRAILTPDFSMYREMSPAMQLYNTFRNRWCGAFYASKGIRVIPTVSWGDENTFDFCFDGIEKGSIVAVSTYMVSEHNNHKDQKEFFLKGYNEMLKRIEPEKIICYNEPFSEMQGDIIYINYELSSWKYMNDDIKEYEPSKYLKYILGEEPLPPNSNIIIKRGYVVRDDFVPKGMGSANGGEWKPKCEEDKRFLGKPGEIKTTYIRGQKFETKIGKDGRAVMERHNTDHNKQKFHTNPHDHLIKWDNPKGFPDPSSPINYSDAVPEFKSYKELNYMSIVGQNGPEENRFKTISDFKWCIKYHGEVEFVYKGKTYSITHPNELAHISEAHKEEMGKWCKNADEVLDYIIDGIRLRDIITEVEILYRTI